MVMYMDYLRAGLNKIYINNGIIIDYYILAVVLLLKRRNLRKEEEEGTAVTLILQKLSYQKIGQRFSVRPCCLEMQSVLSKNFGPIVKSIHQILRCNT